MSEQKYIDKINALLSRAAHEATPQAERETCLAMAEKLRLSHSIDVAALSGKTGNARPKGVMTDTWELNMPYEFYEQVRYLLSTILVHCNLRGMYRGFDKIQVVGFEHDMQYAQALWVTAYAEFAGNLFPHWRGDRPFDDNVYAFVKGGYKWRMIADAANAAGTEVPWPDGGRLIRAYRRACKERGEEPQGHTQRHSAFRASYANAFHNTIAKRLREMRRRAEGEVEDRDRLALALRSNDKMVEEEFYRLFPQFDPEVLRKRSEEDRLREEARRAALTEEERAKEDEKAKKERERARKYHEKLRDKSYDPNGWAHGTAVAGNVDLSAGRGHVGPRRDEIGA